MALVALSYCFPRNYPHSTREVAASVSGSLGEPILRSKLDLVTFKSNPVLCECSRNCSSSSSSHGIGRKFSSGGNSISDLDLEGFSRRAFCKPTRAIKITRQPAVGKEAEEEEEDDDSELCPVECVREFKSRSEFDEILEYSKEQGALVVVDFFKTACGSCRYIEKGFVKLCKGAGNTGVDVIFLKHNVMDEYEEQSEVADSLRIRAVPLFHFYKEGQLVESFATREKTKILQAICRHTGLELDDIPIPREV
ncbi:unnamed protein product [Calypogeia fissa]